MDPYEILPLFTFGTLRRGEENHHYLAERYDRCLEGSLRDFQRTVAGHGFPLVTPTPGEQVEGELFFIRPDLFREVLDSCDWLEDLPPGKLVGSYYQRTRVTIDTSAGAFVAWAYIDPNVPVRAAEI